jgi:hypothetical protein
LNQEVQQSMCRNTTSLHACLYLTAPTVIQTHLSSENYARMQVHSMLTMHHPTKPLRVCHVTQPPHFQSARTNQTRVTVTVHTCLVSSSSGHVPPFPSPSLSLSPSRSQHKPPPTCLTSKAHPTARKKPYISSEHVNKFPNHEREFWWDFTFFFFVCLFVFFFFPVFLGRVSNQRRRNE